MKNYEIVYFETLRITRTIRAKSLENAIARSERLRAKGDWSDCNEDSEGTNGVEQVFIGAEQVYDAGRNI